MALLPKSAYSTRLPKMYRVTQRFDARHIEDPEAVIKQEMSKPAIQAIVKPGMRIALAVGSRGIYNLERIVAALVKELAGMGAEPVIIPSMGSHGAGTAKGQRELLEGYGITQERVGAPIISSIETIRIGETADGVPVLIDAAAHGCDMIVPVARVKPHTDFKSEIESGICKMLTIGLGNHEGCSALHQYGFAAFGKLIPAAAKVVTDNAKVGFGLAVVENAYDKTCLLETVPAGEIFVREPELLKLAKKQMPSILLPSVEVLIIDRLGKDISGAGMDPNITGRTTKGSIPGFTGPGIQRIIVKGITPASHGNACGIGLADYILESCAEQIDLLSTATNSIGSGNPEAGRIPIRVRDVSEGIIASLRTCVGVDYQNLKIVRIKSTLHLGEIFVSEGLLPEVERNPNMELGPEEPDCLM